MTKPKTIQLERIGQSPIDVDGMVVLSDIECIPMWDGEEIVLWDMFYNFEWIGSRRLLRYCEEVNAKVRRNG